MKTKIFILSMVVTLMTIGCSKDNNDTNTAITPEEAGINSKIDMANDDAVDIITEQENNTYANSTNGKQIGEVPYSALTTCATITRVPDFGTPLTVGQTVTKTINFGTTGCTLANGNVVRGVIVMSFVFDPNATSHTVTFTFNDFYHNNIKFNGTKTYIRTMTTATATSPAHPIVTVNIDLTATLTDGRVFTRTGQRVREMIAGFGTADISDDIHRVTGSWTTTFPNMVAQTATISSSNPLLVKMSCVALHKPLIVQGVITYNRNGNTATLDFGDGTCDNTAIFTHNGISVTIIIGN